MLYKPDSEGRVHFCRVANLDFKNSLWVKIKSDMLMVSYVAKVQVCSVQ